MSSLQILKEALKVYEINIISVESNYVKLQNNYEVGVEENNLYKLLNNGNVIAPFNDLNELCRFILRYPS